MKTYEFTTVKGEQTPVAKFTFDATKLNPTDINELGNLIRDNSRGQLKLGYNNTSEGRFYTIESTERHPEYFGSSDTSEFPKTILTVFKGTPDTKGWLCTED